MRGIVCVRRVAPYRTMAQGLCRSSYTYAHARAHDASTCIAKVSWIAGIGRCEVQGSP